AWTVLRPARLLRCRLLSRLSHGLVPRRLLLLESHSPPRLARNPAPPDATLRSRRNAGPFLLSDLAIAAARLRRPWLFRLCLGVPGLALLRRMFSRRRRAWLCLRGAFHQPVRFDSCVRCRPGSVDYPALANSRIKNCKGTRMAGVGARARSHLDCC